MSSKHRVRLIVAIAIVLLAGGGLAVALYVAGGSSASVPDLVKLELRARPLATIRFKGRNLGRTPLTVQLPRSTVPVTFDARFETHSINPSTKDRKVVFKLLTKTVVPDAEQSVDFDIADAKAIGAQHSIAP